MYILYIFPVLVKHSVVFLIAKCYDVTDVSDVTFNDDLLCGDLDGGTDGDVLHDVIPAAGLPLLPAVTLLAVQARRLNTFHVSIVVTFLGFLNDFPAITTVAGFYVYIKSTLCIVCQTPKLQINFTYSKRK